MKKRPLIMIVGEEWGAIPAVSGGSVGTLDELLIEENEKEQLAEFIIYSTHNDEAKRIADGYKHTKVFFVQQKKWYRFWQKRYLSLEKRVPFFQRCFLPPFYREVYRDFCKRNLRPDYIVFESDVASFYAPLIKQLFGKFTDNEIYLHSHEYRDKNYHQFDKKSLADHFSHVICVSEYCANPWPEFLPEINTHVLLNGIDLSRFTKRVTAEEKEYIFNKFGLSENDFMVMFCGTVRADKGVKELVKAIGLVNIPNVKLFIIGAGENGISGEGESAYVKEIREMAKVENLQGRIFLTGYVDNCEVYKYSQLSKIQVVPSMWDEPAGLVNIEGMMSGLPLIVANSGGIPEYVDEECAITVDRGEHMSEDMAEAITTLFYDADKRQRMGDHGRQRAKMFSSQAYYRNFLQLFQN